MQNTTKSSVYLDRRAHQRLATIKSAYSERTELNASASHIIRRALTLLAAYLRKLKDDEVWETEMVALKNHRRRRDL